MAESEPAGDDARTEIDAPTPKERCDLTKFQLRTLAVLSAAEEPIKGLAIKSRLEDYYGTNINHGRLYPNLDDLAAYGFVEKSQRDKRTNDYVITDKGHAVLANEVAWLVARVPISPQYLKEGDSA